MKRTAGFQAVLFMSALEVLPILRTRGQKRVRVERYGMIFADLYLRFFVLDFRSGFCWSIKVYIIYIMGH